MRQTRAQAGPPTWQSASRTSPCGAPKAAETTEQAGAAAETLKGQTPRSSRCEKKHRQKTAAIRMERIIESMEKWEDKREK